MDTSLKIIILKSSYFLKLNKGTLNSETEKGILIVNHANNRDLREIFFSAE